MWILVLLSLLTFGQAAAYGSTVRDLEGINLSEVLKYDNEPLIYQSRKLEVYLTNDYCQQNKEKIYLSKESISLSSSRYARSLEESIASIEGLYSKLAIEPSLKEIGFYPVRLYISVDGHEDCQLAQADGKRVEVAGAVNSQQRSYFSDALKHEIGHMLSRKAQRDHGIMAEAFADALYLYQRPNLQGVFPRQANEYEEELTIWQERLNSQLSNENINTLSKQNQQFYLSLREVLPIYLSCKSKDYMRDFRKKASLSDIYRASFNVLGNYVASCSIHHLLYLLSQDLGARKVYESYLKSLLTDRSSYSDVSILEGLEAIFPTVELRDYVDDYELLKNIPSDPNHDLGLTRDFSYKNPILISYYFQEKAVHMEPYRGNTPFVDLSFTSEEHCESQQLSCFCWEEGNSKDLSAKAVQYLSKSDSFIGVPVTLKLPMGAACMRL